MTIASFNKKMLSDLRNCDSCPLSGRKRVGMDFSEGEAGRRDILFMGLNPGREEAERDLPFVGKSGRLLRESLDLAGISSWAIINSILCYTNNESEIPDVDKCRNYCRINVGQFVRVARPIVIVPCGNGASGLFGMGSGITVNSKKTFVSRGPTGKASPTLVMPIVHPSALLRGGGKSSPAYERFLERLREIAMARQKFAPNQPGYNLDGCEELFGNSGKNRLGD